MTFPYVENYQDIITPDCKLVLDLDQTCYVAAAGAEKRTIIARHKKSGVEKEFKTRTLFWGAKKSAVGGWLEDENTNRAVKAQKAGKNFKPWTKDDFEVIDVQTPQPVEHCLHMLKTKINAIMDHVKIENGLGVLGGEGNFRLLLPSVEQYKSNREGTIRPLLLKEARDYVTKYHNAVVIDHIEADDYLGQLGYAGYLNYKETGKFNYMIASFDKDQCGSPSLIFNTMRERDDDDNSAWKHPYPMLVDESMGHIWMEKSKVKGWGQKFLGYQMLFGDSSDGIKPYQPFDIKFGETSAFKVISPCDTEKEMWQAIIAQYKEWFPNGVKFTSWDGQEIDYTAGQWASVIFQMVYMKRVPNDRTTLSSTLRRVGAI